MVENDKQKIAKDEKTKKRIIAYAGQIFYERGFRKVTIEELCAGMAMSKRTFYKHFANREELVQAFLAENIGQIMGPVFANLTSNKPINEILETHFHLLATELFPRVSTQMMVDIQTLMPELWERVDFLRSQIANIVTRLLERGQKEGAINPNLDPQVFGKIFQELLNSVATPGFLVSQNISLLQVIETMQVIFLRGLLVSPQDEPRKEKETSK